MVVCATREGHDQSAVVGTVDRFGNVGVSAVANTTDADFTGSEGGGFLSEAGPPLLTRRPERGAPYKYGVSRREPFLLSLHVLLLDGEVSLLGREDGEGVLTQYYGRL